MINLLPPAAKRELRASRLNTVLRQYLVSTLCSLAAVIVVLGGGLYLNYLNTINHEQQLAQSKQNLAGSQEVKQRIGAYNKNLQAAKLVLDGEIRLTNLVDNISSVLPQGAVLENVALDTNSFTQPVSITAKVNSFEKAAVMERNLKQSGLFTQVTLTGVQNQLAGEPASADAPAAPTPYPFNALFDITLGPNAATQDFDLNQSERSVE